MSNVHEEFNRARKVAALARVIPCGRDATEIAATADFFAALPIGDRVAFAEEHGIKPPSDATWTALIAELRARKSF